FNLIFGNAVDEAPPSVNEITVTASPPTPEAIRSPRKQMFSDLPTPSYHKTQFHDPLNASAYHHFDKEAYDTGFIPLQPSYEAPMYPQQLQPQPEGAYNSFNGALAPTTSRDPQRDFTTKEAKQKRRESGMMTMNMGLAGQRRTSTQRLRE
ncbi:Rho GTPase activating protein, partial [Cryomyces antarcticus]